MWVESELDKGSRFTFWIPLQQVEAPSEVTSEIVKAGTESKQAC